MLLWYSYGTVFWGKEACGMRTTVYLDDETAEKVEYLPRKYNLSSIMRVVLAALVFDDEEFAVWLKAERKRRETYLWIKEKVGGKRKIELD
jgi:hypothetical protein